MLPEAIAVAADHFRAFLQTLGLDVDDPHLRETPRRVATMFATELFAPHPFTFTTFPAEGDSLVLVRDIPFVSICAHHLLPFRGVAHVGYIPTDRLVGLSKLARTVEYHARAPQVQERLTDQIADFLDVNLDPLGVGVVLEATHLCMEIRGVQKPGTTTTTSALRGVLRDEPEARAEFMALVRKER